MRLISALIKISGCKIDVSAKTREIGVVGEFISSVQHPLIRLRRENYALESASRAAYRAKFSWESRSSVLQFIPSPTFAQRFR